MGLNGGPQDDLAADIELAVQLSRAGLQVRERRPRFLVPLLFLSDSVVEIPARPVHDRLPADFASLKYYPAMFAISLMATMRGYDISKPG
jgi:hypothetical protein